MYAMYVEQQQPCVHNMHSCMRRLFFVTPDKAKACAVVELPHFVLAHGV